MLWLPRAVPSRWLHRDSLLEQGAGHCNLGKPRMDSESEAPEAMNSSVCCCSTICRALALGGEERRLIR